MNANIKVYAHDRLETVRFQAGITYGRREYVSRVCPNAREAVQEAMNDLLFAMGNAGEPPFDVQVMGGAITPGCYMREFA